MKHLFTILLLCLSFNVFGQETELNNSSIIEMTKAGIPASVIIAKIKSSPNKFDTELPALKILNDASVSEVVISAMIEIMAAKHSANKADAIEVERKAAEPKIVSPSFTPFSQLDKSGQKQRIKSPAQIGIAAKADKVAPILIRAFQSWDYQIESETSRTLLFSKPVPGMGNKLLVGMAMGGNNLRYKIQVTVSEYEGISNVIVTGWVTSDNAFGKTNQETIDNNKKWRTPLDDLLLAVKRRAEGNIQ